jgi:hypothetical protein
MKIFLYLAEFIVILILVLVVSIFYLNQSVIGLVFNPELLIVHGIIRDLSGSGYLKDWFFPTTTMFFPDWMVSFISFMAAKNIYFQGLITACLNTLLLYGGVSLIYRQFFSRVESFIFSLTSLGVFLLLAMSIVEPYIYLFFLGEHIGAFIIGLVYVFIQMKLIEESKNENKASRLLFLAVSISLAMGLSDLLFIIQFSLPAFFTYMLMYIKKQVEFKEGFLFSFVPLCFSVFGGWLIPHMIHTRLDYSSLNQISLTSIKDNGYFIINNFKIITDRIQSYWPAIIFLSYINFFLRRIYF